MSLTRREKGSRRPGRTLEPGTEWRVWHVRTPWNYGKGKVFQTRRQAERYMGDVCGADGDFAWLDYATLQRRDVGEWETVAEHSDTETLPKRKRWRANRRRKS